MKQLYIILGIVIIILLAGGMFAWQKRNNTQPSSTPPTNSKPTVIPPAVTPTTSNDSSYKKPDGWKTYENKELGFKIAYPADWYAYDKARWEKENAEKECPPSVGFLQMGGVLFSKKDLGSRCVDYYPDPRFTGLSFRVIQGEIPSAQNIDQPGVTIITVDGEKAMKVPTLENTTIPQRSNFISLAFNHKDRGYIIYFSQTDRNGNYDPILDQILSTFHFLD